MAAVTLGGRLRAFLNSPTGPKTTHFWGPVANWGFVLAVSPIAGARRAPGRAQRRARAARGADRRP